MSVIYRPEGKAREYADLALNIYKGCTHGCLYCFGPAATHCKKEAYFAAANPKKDILKKVKRQCKSLTAAATPEILISFIGDAYQPEEKELGLTRETIKILIQHELKFTILTKGGMLAARDFDLLRRYPKARFGTSLVFEKHEMAQDWEPNARPVWNRSLALQEAKSLGMSTWVSLEPVIDPAEALKVIRKHHKVVDHWKVGKINYWPEIEKQVDWIAFREEVTELLDSLGADYYIKKSLAEWVNG